jgi:TetR/AcrR family transcriptional repressor of nem operon
MYNMDTRQAILEATKALLWEKGYEATSPRDILDRSQAGQGSLYHHFGGKKQLAAEALAQVVEERIQAFESAIAGEGGIKKRLHAYLAQEKNALKGCRIGRMVWDAAIEEDELRQPLQKYFRHVERRLTQELQQALARKQVRLALPAGQLALLIVAAVQGSFTISRALQVSRMNEAMADLRQLLDVVITGR